MSRRPAVRVEGLTIGYRARSGAVVDVLRDVNLSLEHGETLGLVGESGCGKSTLAFALLGYLRSGSVRTAGVVRIGDTDIFRCAPAELQRLRGRAVALVPQNAGAALTPTMRVGAQVAESLRLHHDLTGAAANRRAVELLGQVRLPAPDVLARRYPHELSGGQQQRVAIAMALAGEPQVLVLDEPTTGLDVTTQAHILDLLQSIREETGAAMVYVSHDLGVIARVSDRLAVMYAGEITEHGSATAIFQLPRHPYTRGLLASVPRVNRSALPRAMPGQPPPPGILPVGCAFAPRCIWADDLCSTVAPPLQVTPGGRQVRCHHWEQLPALPAPDATQPRQHVLAGVRAGDCPASSLVQAEHLAVSYARRSVATWLATRRGQPSPPPTVAGISLTIRSGETLALVGESGSGKSTLARALAGLQRPSAGRLRFGPDGALDLAVGVERRPKALLREIQIIFQNPDASLNPRQTVAQIIGRPLQLFFGLDSVQRRKRSVELLEQVRLRPQYLERYPSQLSGGEKQRVAIARAFAAEPSLVLCDEVVSALDVSVQAAVLELLSGLQRDRGVTYLFITHDLAVVRAVADRVAVLYQGRLCEVGTVEQVYNPPYHPYTETLLAAVLEPEPGAARRSLPAGSDAPEAGPPATGCPFQNRCPRRIGPICDEVAPPWRSDAAGLMIRCHLPLEVLHAPLVLHETTLSAGQTLAQQHD